MTRGTPLLFPVTESNVVRETLLSAVTAGLVAALALTFMQGVWITPLILQAETYEQGEAASAHDESAGAIHEHHHDVDAWKPQDGLQRTAFTFAANMLMGFGYAFLLMAIYLLWRQPASAAWGAIYGLAGFVVFFVAPALGLPPELPGTAAAEVAARQLWWLFIASATAVGLILLFSRVSVWVRLIGLALIVAPHWVPAPQPVAAASLAPAELQSQFRVATAVCNGAFWLLLGFVSSIAFRKFVAADVRFKA